MSRGPALLLALAAVFLSLWLPSWAGESGDEQALRALAARYAEALAREDLEGCLALWSATSPGLAAERKQLAAEFAGHDSLRVVALEVRRIEIEGDRALARYRLDATAVEAATGKPCEHYRNLERALRCVREDGAWKILALEPAEAYLARALVQAKTPEEEEKLLHVEAAIVGQDLLYALRDLGMGLRSGDGSVEETLRAFSLLQRVGGRVGDREWVAIGLGETAYTQFVAGRHEQAVQVGRESLRLFEELDLKGGIAWQLRAIGESLLAMGKTTEALEHLDRAVAVTQAPDQKSQRASALGTQARIYRDLHQYDRALLLLEQSRALFEALGKHGLVAWELAMTGSVYQAMGSDTDALVHYHAALERGRARGDKDTVTRSQQGIAQVLTNRGDAAAAVALLQEGLPGVPAESPNHPRMLYNLAAALHDAGRYTEALDILEQARKEFERFGNDRGVRSTLRRSADVYHDMGRFSEALARCMAALEMAGDHEHLLRTDHYLCKIGIIHCDMGNFAAALPHLEKAVALCEVARDEAGIAHTLPLLADAKKGVGRKAEALADYQRTIGMVEEQRKQNPLAGTDDAHAFFGEGQAHPYHAAADICSSSGRTAEAFELLERSRARTLLDILHSGHTPIRKGLAPQELEELSRREQRLALANADLEAAEHLHKPAPDQVSRAKRAREEARLDLEQYIGRIYAAHPQLRVRRFEVEPVRLATAGELLREPGTAVLEYVSCCYGSRLYVLSKSGRGARSRLVLRSYPIAAGIREQDLAARINAFARLLSNPSLPVRAEARRLYDLLLKPAEAQLAGVRRLIIVPDGALWNLPFQALQRKPGRYLVEDHAIAYAHSLTALREMRSLADRRRRGPRTLLALGNPDIGATMAARGKFALRRGELLPLREAVGEVRNLGALYGRNRSTVLTGSQASERRAKELAPSARVIHFATHGVVDNSSPLYSHLVLARSEAPAPEDGLLEAREILELELQAELAVLAACETAGGRLTDGDGVIGLSWAFFVAGCPSVVVSKWKVESRATRELMVLFHRNLRATGKAEALRQAQQTLLHTTATRHPFYWAGFVVVGDGR